MTSSIPRRPLNSSLRRLKALIIKEFLQIIRDPSSILIAFVFPMILLFLYGVAVSLDATHVKIGLVLEEYSPDVISFSQSFLDSPYFDVTISKTVEPFKHQIVKGSIRGFVVVPSYFSSFRHQKAKVAPLQVIADGSEPNTAGFLQNYVRGAWENWLKQEKISQNLQGLSPIRIQPRFWYNEELSSHNSLVPGSLAIIMTLIGTLLTALVLSKEWERGTMEAMMATSVSIHEILLGKLIPYFILGMGSMVINVTVATLIYHIPLRGSLLALFITSAAFLFVALGLGLLISTTAKNQFVATQAALVTAFLPAFILSGFIFEISSMPLPIQMITMIIPAKYFVTTLQTIFLAGNIWSLIIPNLGILLIMGLFLFFITSFKTNKRLD